MQKNETTKQTADSPISMLAHRYGDVLYELATKQNTINEVEKDMNNFANLMNNSQDLKDFAKSPIFSIDDKQNAFGKIIEKMNCNDLFAKFIKTIIANKRSELLMEIIFAFRAKLSQMRGEILAQITAAHELSQTQIEKLQNILKTISGKDIDLQISYDSSLQGGMIVKIGSKQIDTSLKTKLSSLKLTLKEAG